jgi:hypothetical protein
MFERHFYDFNDLFTRDVGNAHVIQAIGVIEMVVIEPRAITRLPRRSAYHTKLSGASTTEW